MKRRFKNEKYNHLLNEIQYEFKAEAKEDTTEITIYGDIGESYWYESISAKDVKDALKDVNTETITVHLNSAGGDVFDGIAIYNLLKNHEAKVFVYVDGLAASAASLIAMAADELIMNTGSMLMIHEASTFAFGNKTEIKKTLKALEGVDKSIVDVYMTRYQGDREEIETMLQNETWFTSTEAVEIGLADRVNKEEETVDPEEFKNSILQKFRTKKQQQIAASASNSILSKFKRNENV